MGLRKEFSYHKRKTLDAFTMVRDDILLLNSGLNSVKKMFVSAESKISGLNNTALALNNAVEKLQAETLMQRQRNDSADAKISGLNDIAKELFNTLNSLNNKLNKHKAQSRLDLKKASAQVKKISKATESRLKRLVESKVKSLKKQNQQLDSKIKAQRKLISTAKKAKPAKKAKSKKAAKRKPARKAVPTKRILTKKTITPKKTVIEVRQQEIKK